ncbi:hypothetical protein [Citrobacter sp. Cb028]|uniref:hypothetical protein n=1 Tax=Citrobacter sp. Cb028 TaxID=2985024 RepID=UPI00257790B6|nr:hypothetical protein [Citrobacter sp. Cb028]MDM3455713.1 hypothetical protein [Citrobacter sp. Cb028]
MTALNKQALREAAQEEIMLRSVSDTSDAWQDEASPEAVLALLDELEKAQAQSSAWCEAFHKAVSVGARYEKRIAELSASHSKLRDTMATIHNTIRMDGGYTPLAAILNAAKRAYDESAIAAGISVKGE